MNSLVKFYMELNYGMSSLNGQVTELIQRCPSVMCLFNFPHVFLYLITGAQSRLILQSDKAVGNQQLKNVDSRDARLLLLCCRSSLCR
jgi:hypothetical protein